MRIWVDADACPGPIKNVIIRAAERLGIETTFVANHFVSVPRSAHVTSVQVATGFDVADDHIAAAVKPGDIVITQDIPLAAEIVDKGAAALNPRGTLYTRENIKSHLARRNFMEELRATGTLTGGPAALGRTDVADFANALDRFLAQRD